MLKCINIAGRAVGPECLVFVVAEAGVNHNGDAELARKLIDVAVDSGADAIKFQTFRAEALVSIQAPKAAYQLASTDPTETHLDMLRRLELPFATFAALADYARGRGILFLSTAFDEESVDFIASLGVPAFKLPSGEITNLSLVRRVARLGRPLLISTGMSNLSEVESAVEAVHTEGNRDVVLLHCVSNYPALPENANLRAIQTLIAAFRTPVGYSDHTSGSEISVAAVALGACVIEKHITLDRGLPGPDHRAADEPADFASLVRSIRAVEAALGDGRKRRTASEDDTAAAARRSLVAACAITRGTTVTEDLVVARRPGTGLPPSLMPYVLGRRSRSDIPAGAVLSLEMLE